MPLRKIDKVEIKHFVIDRNGVDGEVQSKISGASADLDKLKETLSEEEIAQVDDKTKDLRIFMELRENEVNDLKWYEVRASVMDPLSDKMEQAVSFASRSDAQKCFDELKGTLETMLQKMFLSGDARKQVKTIIDNWSNLNKQANPIQGSLSYNQAQMKFKAASIAEAAKRKPDYTIKQGKDGKYCVCDAFSNPIKENIPTRQDAEKIVSELRSGATSEGVSEDLSEKAASKKKKEVPNPWAVCTDSVGRKDKDKYEKCVKDVKKKNKKQHGKEHQSSMITYNFGLGDRVATFQAEIKGDDILIRDVFGKEAVVASEQFQTAVDLGIVYPSDIDTAKSYVPFDVEALNSTVTATMARSVDALVTKALEKVQSGRKLSKLVK